jgi:N-acylneuraminate cytidylyltransferase
LATDDAGTLVVVRHAVEWLVAHNESDARDGPHTDLTAVCCLYPTTPLLRPSDLAAGWEVLRQTDAPFVAAVVASARGFHRSFRIADGRIEWLFPEYASTRTQDLPSVYFDAGQFYWGTTRAWIDEDAILGPRTATVVLPSDRGMDIDTEADWQAAEQMYGALGQSVPWVGS